MQQKRADQGNRLMSQQGPEAVGRVVDALIGHKEKAALGPDLLRPVTSALAGPAGQTEVQDLLKARARRHGLIE